MPIAVVVVAAAVVVVVVGGDGVDCYCDVSSLLRSVATIVVAHCWHCCYDELLPYLSHCCCCCWDWLAPDYCSCDADGRMSATDMALLIGTDVVRPGHVL